MEKAVSNVCASLNVTRVIKSMGMGRGRLVAPMGGRVIHTQFKSNTPKGKGHWGIAGGREISKWILET